MKVYFAQIMDNLAYYEHEKKIADLLEANGHEVYFPWRDEGVIFEDQSTLQDTLKTFNTDVDHIWPKAILNKKSEISKIMNPTTEQITNFKNGCNSILNLQLLRSKENREKSDTEYNKWLKTRFTDENALNNYLDTNLIPNNISYELKDIEFFWNERKKLLSDRIREAFPNKFEDLIRRYDLQNTIK